MKLAAAPGIGSSERGEIRTDPLELPAGNDRRRVSTPGSGDSSGASEVMVRGISHGFGEQQVLSNVDMVAKAGDFVTLLGPSGSGKTTLLRIIAGLIRPDAGRVLVDDEDITQLPTQARNMGFVFQSYALFPHLTVEENIAFALQMRHTSKREQRRRTAEMLEMVALQGLGNRRPGELSGGQQQRVALARAMAHSPRVLLLDEPLGALDRRLRQRLGEELRRVQRETGTTSIYVTHDQEEAFLLSDKVVVMNGGMIRQSGPPPVLYESPSDLFVAQFLGDTNRFEGVVTQGYPDRAVVDIGGSAVTCSWNANSDDAARVAKAGDIVTCVLRPESLVIQAEPDARGLCQLGNAEVEDSLYMGNRHRLIVRWRGSQLLVDINRGGRVPEVGARVSVASRDGAMVALPKDGEGPLPVPKGSELEE